MLTDIREHRHDYVILFGGFCISLLLFWLYRTDVMMMRMISIWTGVFYVVWGMVHHHRSHHLTAPLVLEYLLVAILGMLFVNATLGI